MLAIRLLSLGLLLHEATYISTGGLKYLTRCIAPTFGLHLPPQVHGFLHLSFIVISVILLIEPNAAQLYGVFFLLLSLIILSYSIRLSNHLLLAWFFLGFLCLDTIFSPNLTSFFYSGMQLTTIATYLFSAFAKLNRDYLSIDRSCGARNVQFFLLAKGVSNPFLHRLAPYIGIHAVIMLECLIPFFLLIPYLRWLGIVLAVLLHIVFGFLAHVHFSTIMMAGLTTFFFPNDGLLYTHFSWIWIGIVILFGTLLGWQVGVWSVARNRILSCLIHILFGIEALLVLLWCVMNSPNLSNFVLIPESHYFIWCSLYSVVLFNGISPYLGIKTGFSFIMFSNLRPDSWSHLFVKSPVLHFPIARYVEIKEIDLPTLVRQNSSDPMIQTILQDIDMRFTHKYSLYYLFEALTYLYYESQFTAPIQLKVSYCNRYYRFTIPDLPHKQGTLIPIRLSLFPRILTKNTVQPSCE